MRVSFRPLWWLVLMVLGCSSPAMPAAPPPGPEAKLGPHVDPAPTPPVAIAEGALSYRIERAPKGDIVVHLAFRGDASGETSLRLPNTWGGEGHLYDGIVGLAIEEGDAKIVPGEEPDRPVVHHAPNAEIHLRYSIAEKEGETLSAQHYRPIVRDDYFHLIGEAFIVHPHWDERKQRSVDLAWVLPEGATVADSYGSGATTQHISTSIAELRHSIYVGGDFRLRSIAIHGQPVFAAIRGKWDFSDDDFMTLVGHVVEAERGFFHDDDFPFYLVTLIPTGERCCSLGGTGLTNSFATFVSTGVRLDGRMKHLLSHELFHTWNGRKIGRSEPEQLVYWFSEGFTDYYANLLQLRSGLIDLPAYVDLYDKALRDYFLSSARTVDNKAILDGFWKNQEIERLPYQRGNILAHEWNARIRDATGGKASIDDVMRDLFAEAQSQGTVVSGDAIDRLVKKRLPEGIAPDLAKYVDQGALLAPSGHALGPCIKLVHKRMGPFDFGLDMDATEKSGKLVGVRHGGPAERAGLHDGQAIAHTKYRSDPSTPVEITLVDAPGKKRTVSYSPQSETRDVPQYELDRAHFDKSPNECLAWFHE